jgi:tetratricopeptide (TPR) repeat protein
MVDGVARVVRIAGSPDGGGRPDPGAAGTAAEFVDALRRLKNWAGVGFRRLEKAAAASGQVLPRSTITAALNRAALPREELVAALVRACGGDEEEVDRWVAARRRIAAEGPSPVPSAVDMMTAGLAPGPVRCTLPVDQAVFVGRDKELEQIATAVADVAWRGGVIAIYAIDGMPGVGKTALAVHLAHRLADRFGDRQLFVDLHAHTPGRPAVPSGDALAQLLAADGVDARFLPDTVDGRASLWRDRMAGKRLLLVLDNVAGSEQVVPLLPGSAGSLVLVTSRRGLGDIPSAVPVPLGVLAEDEAITMFVRLAPRAAADRQAVAQVVRVCGFLPLAISILASVYLRHRSWTLQDLVREVHRSGGGPLRLTAENRTVAAVFDLSYHHLPADRRRLFRLLAVHPGVDIDPYAAAALAGIAVEEARQHLDGLHTDHLLEEPVYRRYRMHDLVRAYAQNLADTVDPVAARQEAAGRLLDYYLHTAALAMDLAYPYERLRRPKVVSAGTGTPVLADRSQADRWLDTELANLLAAAHDAAKHDRPEHTWHLSAILDRHLRTRGRYPDAQTLHQQALDLAGWLGNHAAQMGALNGLGYVHWMVGRYEQAGDHHRRALQIAQAIGDRGGERSALHGLGHVHLRLGDYEQADDHFGRALQIAQAIGDQGGEMDALNGLGYVHWMVGHYEVAGDHFGRALSIAHAIGDRRGELNALNGLGYVHWLLDRHEQARDHHGRAQQIAQGIGDRRGEMNALHGLGDVHRRLGRFEQSGGHYGRALQIAQAIGDRGGELNALNGLGYVHLMVGRFEQSGDHCGRALQIAQAIGDRGGELSALAGLGTVHRMLGRHSQAADCYQQVLAVAGELHSSNWQYEALQGLGRLHHATGRPDLALVHHEQALRHATDLAQRSDQARAHDGLAHAHHAKGQHEQARRHWQHALDILTSLGTDHTEDIEANVANIRTRLDQMNALDQRRTDS